MYFGDYGLGKRRLDMYLKSAVLQYTSTSNIVKAIKHISNYCGGTSIILIDHQ